MKATQVVMWHFAGFHHNWANSNCVGTRFNFITLKMRSLYLGVNMTHEWSSFFEKSAISCDYLIRLCPVVIDVTWHYLPPVQFYSHLGHTFCSNRTLQETPKMCQTSSQVPELCFFKRVLHGLNLIHEKSSILGN